MSPISGLSAPYVSLTDHERVGSDRESVPGQSHSRSAGEPGCHLVTVHGPLNPAVDPSAAFRETRSVRNRIESGRVRDLDRRRAERLAVIAAVTPPITALVSVYGMNIIVNQQSDSADLAVVLAVMAFMSAALRLRAKRHGWW